MPLFKSSQPSPPPPAQSSPPTRSRSIFSRNTNGSDPSYNNNNNNGYNDYNNNNNNNASPTRSGGFFSRRRSSSSDDTYNGNLRKDPSILAARQKVADAEAFEREADRALGQARGAVREAREHVKWLEREALEDARRAKAKQAEAKTVSKSARGLGRHG